ncbi:T6SS immunity protein Tdi1 domain-containing protein [Rhizobium sp. BK376]|uniref:T6SS immunity protein Tdi1 domain-containing protein n=1 Tax=Rhizobium sp. BK376 TaxID=2512149 RepID=UPI00104755FA|nr:T6SS immunity protein Tdi1 domain-containing protein [Rhizobium sp. BK376]TCR90765.1 uncharacterized protein DUF1851 [Rhizobium sp. BK376]
MLRQLAVSCDDMDCDHLLMHWHWLVPADAKPLMIGIFGDWIFGAPDGSHWHLDLLEGDFHRIADSSDDFNEKKDQDQFRNEWFGADLAEIALGNGLVPTHEECLGWKIAPILGGSFSMDNIEVFPLTVYQAITGQLFRQLFANK